MIVFKKIHLLAAALCLGCLYTLFINGFIPINLIPNSRTLYEGYIEIEHTDLTEIKARLITNGCQPLSQTGLNEDNLCLFQEKYLEKIRRDVIEVFPRGQSFGPNSYYIIPDRIITIKDIPGPPNPKKFYSEVKEDIHLIGNVVTHKSETYHLDKIIYPWTVIY